MHSVRKSSALLSNQQSVFCPSKWAEQTRLHVLPAISKPTRPFEIKFPLRHAGCHVLEWFPFGFSDQRWEKLNNNGSIPADDCECCTLTGIPCVIIIRGYWNKVGPVWCTNKTKYLNRCRALKQPSAVRQTLSTLCRQENFWRFPSHHFQTIS